MIRYRVTEDTERLKEGDILVQDDKHTYLYCTDKVCTTIFTIEKNPEKFDLIDNE